MSNQYNKVNYGFNQPLNTDAPTPIRAPRMPNGFDVGYLPGTIWIDTPNNQGFLLTSVVDNIAHWIAITASGAGPVLSITAQPSGGIALPTGGGTINFVGSGGATITATGPNTITISTIAGTGTVTSLSAATGITLTPNPITTTGTIGLTIPVVVSSGGTGATTLTANSLLLGNGTAPLSGLGVATNGQLPIGSTGAAPVLATLTGGTGITITNGAGSINIAATTTFATNTGSTVPLAGTLSILGGTGISTAVTSSGTITITNTGGGGSVSSASIIGTGYEGLTNTAAISYNFLYGGNTIVGAQGTTIPTAGTISNLYVNPIINGSTGNVTFTLYKNGVATALTTTATASSTATVSDLTHSVSVVAGDVVSMQSTQATSSNIIGEITMAFTAAGSGTVGAIIGTAATAITTSIVYAAPFGPGSTTSTTSGLPSPITGIAEDMYINAYTNTSTAPVTYTLYVNSAPTALVVTVPASTTGVFSDITHTVAIAAGNLLMWQISQASGGGVGAAISMAII